jgi:hypothetical protein
MTRDGGLSQDAQDPYWLHPHPRVVVRHFTGSREGGGWTDEGTEVTVDLA